MAQNVDNCCSVQVFSRQFWFADRHMGWLSAKVVEHAFDSDQLTLPGVVICSNLKSNHDKFKSNPNQITTFQIKSCSQIKSPGVIQSRFKSNRDLDLPITGRETNNYELFQYVTYCVHNYGVLILLQQMWTYQPKNLK